jgi:hypothetical protein
MLWDIRRKSHFGEQNNGDYFGRFIRFSKAFLSRQKLY